MKTLILDIETAPMEVLAWGMFKQNIPKIIHDPYMLMIGYMWEGDEEATILSLPDHKTFYKKNPRDSSKMLERFSKQVEEADLVVAHNLTGFDWKWLQGEAFVNGLPPLKTPMLECTLKLARQFKVPSKRLDYLTKRLGMEGKINHRGIDLWWDCMNGDPEAWQEMAAYCKQDVEILHDFWIKLRPWSKKNLKPNAEGSSCTKCGSSDVGLHSNRYTAGGIAYPYYRCNSCGGYSSGRSQVSKGVLK